MKRSELLKTKTSEESQELLELKKVGKADTKFLDRKIRSIKEKVEDAETALEERLSSISPLDESVIEVLYQEILTQKQKLELYEEFQKECI